MNAIVITFDRLALSELGCYGNDWIETQNLDRLASQAVVFDQHFIEHCRQPNTQTDLSAANHAWWTGRFQFARIALQRDRQPNLADVLREAGIATSLVFEHSVGQSTPAFDCMIEASGSDGSNVDAKETPFGQAVSRCSEELARLARTQRRPWLLWLKSVGVPFPCVPPRGFVELYDDEFGTDSEDDSGGAADDATIESVDDDEDVPSEDAPVDDAWHAARAATAGYVTLLDAWLGELLDDVEGQLPGQPLLLIVTAASGGDPRQLDSKYSRPAALNEEVVHTPLIVRVTGGLMAGSRCQSLVQTVDLVPTLLDWFQVDAKADGVGCEGRSLLPVVTSGVSLDREFAFLGDGDHARAIRSRDFYLVRQMKDDGSDHSRLYVKPDDIWDVNDVAEQNPDAVDKLAQRLDEFAGLGETAGRDCPE